MNKKMINVDKLKIKILNQITTIFVNNDFSNIGELLTSCRKLIENDDILKTTFSTLFFYSNWILHSRIDKNKNVYTIFEKINMGFVAEAAIPNSITEHKFGFIFSKDYTDVVIDALDVNGLLENTRDFIYSFGINMPSIDGDLIINGVHTQMTKEEQLKFLVSNGNLDVSISFIKENGREVRKKFLLYIFKLLEHIEIKLPDRKRQDLYDKVRTYLESQKANIQPVIIKSIVVCEVKDNQVFFEMEIDNAYNTKIHGSFFV